MRLVTEVQPWNPRGSIDEGSRIERGWIGGRGGGGGGGVVAAPSKRPMPVVIERRDYDNGLKVPL